MITLLIVADDFTGALDTGVQLAGSGARTRVVTDPAFSPQSAEGAEVLVIDAETRHLPPAQAADIVGGIVRRAVEQKVPYIYKKTDSALRGNVGAELGALLAASGEEALPFLPAYPQIGRCTKGGVHYIDGQPVAESVFGIDPFEPVRHSDLAGLIGAQSGVPVHSLPADGPAPSGQGIYVYDACSLEDLEQTGRTLAAAGRLHISAGCAGFGAVLPRLLGLGGKECAPEPRLDPRLLVVCGSVNPITVAQLDAAEQAGFARMRLSPRQKLEPGYWHSEEGRAARRPHRGAAAGKPPRPPGQQRRRGQQPDRGLCRGPWLRAGGYAGADRIQHRGPGGRAAPQSGGGHHPDDRRGHPAAGDALRRRPGAGTPLRAGKGGRSGPVYLQRLHQARHHQIGRVRADKPADRSGRPSGRAGRHNRNRSAS